MNRDPYFENMRARRDDAKAAAIGAIHAKRWICDDGHKHTRPEKFTTRRLQQEMNRRHPRNDWTSAEMWLAVHELVDEGALKQGKDWSLSVSEGFKWASV